MHSRLIPAALLLALAWLPAEQAAAQEFGVYGGISPGYASVMPKGRDALDFTLATPQLGVFVDDFIGDERSRTYIDVDLSLFANAAWQGGLDLMGVDTQPLDDIAFPPSKQDPSRALGVNHAFNFRAVGLTFELPANLYAGGSMGVDAAGMAVIPTDERGQFGAWNNAFWGDFFFDFNAGPAIGWEPIPELLLVLNPTVGVMLSDNEDYYAGWHAAGRIDAFWHIVPRWLDLKVNVGSEYRSFSYQRARATETADFFTTFVHTSLLLRFGGIMDMFEEG